MRDNGTLAEHIGCASCRLQAREVSVPALLVDFPQSMGFVAARFLFTVALLLLFASTLQFRVHSVARIPDGLKQSTPMPRQHRLRGVVN